MYHLKIAALSVNEAYKGRKFATDALKQYKHDLGYLLPRIVAPEGKLSVRYHFGVSSKKSDGDNCIKAFQDCLSEMLGINDKMIYEWHIKKIDVPKGEEFIEFDIEKLI